MKQLFAALILCFTGLVQPALGDHLGPVQEAIGLATVTEFTPFVWKADGEARGIDVDIVMEMCRRMDLHCHLEFHPWSRVLAQIESGGSAGGFSGFRTPEREAYAHFLSHPLHFSTYNLFVKSGQEFDFSQISDLFGRTVGITRGFAVSPAFERAVAKGKISVQEADSPEQNLRKLLAGNRIDAVIGNYHKMRIKVAQMGVSCELSCLPTPIVPPRPAYLMISRKWQHPRKKELLDQMNQTLKSMYQDGTIDRINSEYLD